MLSVKTNGVISSTGLGESVTLSQSSLQWNKLNSLSTAIYVSEQVFVSGGIEQVHIIQLN